MATNAYTIADRTLVNKMLQHEIRLAQFFNVFMGTATETKHVTTGGQQAWNFAGTPINVIENFKVEGRTK